jgi:hypothetical protein
VLNAGSKLRLKGTRVAGFDGVGILLSPNTSGGTTKLIMEENSGANGNGGGNILVRPVGSTAVRVEISNARIYEGGGFGFKIDTTAGTGAVNAEIVDSMMFSAGTNGITVNAPTVAGSVVVSNTHINNSANFGVYANGANATILLNNSTITNSAVAGVMNNGGGTVASYGNNGINLNANNNTGILTLQSLH